MRLHEACCQDLQAPSCYTRAVVCPIEYNVSLREPQTQTLSIRMVVRELSSPTFDVALPVWRPGKYSVLNPAGAVSNVRAQTTSGKTLPISKVDKTTWRVQTGGASEVEVSYTVYANSLNDRTRHVDDTHAFLSGSAVFFYAPNRRGDAVTVHLDLPPGWKIASGLAHAEGDPSTLLASSYDVLMDSPIEAGQHDVLRFVTKGIPHEIVIWGNPAYDGDRLAHDFEKIVDAEAEIFGELPYDRYVFMIHAAPGLGGGTEHLNSTIMQLPLRSFEDEDNYQRVLSLASHELFHAWNVKRLRPAALRTIDFSKENYTDLLWFCEGTTSYYDDLIVVRAGLNSPDAYLRTLSEAIHQLRNRPGARVQSLAESSFDAWIKFNHPTPDDVNTTVSYYEAGAMASFLFDLQLRSKTGNRVSLDTLMREMYTRFPASGPGFTTRDLIEVASAIASVSFEPFFQQYISGVERYPFEELLDVVGLELSLGGKAEHEAPAKAYIGLSLQGVDGVSTVRAVFSDGPAYVAGIYPGDDIVALDGRRFSAADLTNHIETRMNPGDSAQLQVMRRNRLRLVNIVLGSKPAGRWQLRRVSKPTPAQKRAYASWLNQEW
jgi:predicted metalloprotease with PDZ domain